MTDKVRMVPNVTDRKMTRAEWYQKQHMGRLMMRMVEPTMDEVMDRAVSEALFSGYGYIQHNMGYSEAFPTSTVRDASDERWGEIYGLDPSERW